MLGESGSESRSYTNVQCGVVHTAHDVNPSSFLHSVCFWSGFSLLRPAARIFKYEDTAGRPRNDEDPVGGSVLLICGFGASMRCTLLVFSGSCEGYAISFVMYAGSFGVSVIARPR